MKLYVGITDYHWFHLHASKERVDEVNFWKPSSQLGFNVPANQVGRIREEFENGRDYYRLDGQPLRQPENQLAFPAIERLKYHYENEFRG